ncbi:MAG: hypothetical protein U1F20_09355 [Lysobacterales bacterium]
MAPTMPGDAANSATATSNGITLRQRGGNARPAEISGARLRHCAHEPDQALLLTVRDASGDNATPVALQATVSDLKGGERPLQLREIAPANSSTASRWCRSRRRTR